jgi:hypothetical protein
MEEGDQMKRGDGTDYKLRDNPFNAITKRVNPKYASAKWLIPYMPSNYKFYPIYAILSCEKDKITLTLSSSSRRTMQLGSSLSVCFFRLSPQFFRGYGKQAV